MDTLGEKNQFSLETMFSSKYRILGEIATGRGAVYKAENLNLGWTVALKILSPYEKEEREISAFFKRFRRAAEAARSIDHPNAITIYDNGTENDFAYLEMEYFGESDLANLIKARGHLSIQETLSLSSQICSVLAAAHKQGIIHFDVKPAKLRLTKNARDEFQLKMFDFGMAKVFSGGSTNLATMTKTGNTVGDPHYMSPELFTGKRVGPQTDVYSLGVVVYEMLSGRVPFPSSGLLDVMLAHLNETPPLLREIGVEVPEGVERIVMQTLSKKPEERPQSPGYFLEALRDAVDSSTAVSSIVDNTPLDIDIAIPSSRRKQKQQQKKNKSAFLLKNVRPLAVGAVSFIVCLAAVVLAMRPSYSPPLTPPPVYRDPSAQILERELAKDNAIERTTPDTSKDGRVERVLEKSAETENKEEQLSASGREVREKALLEALAANTGESLAIPEVGFRVQVIDDRLAKHLLLTTPYGVIVTDVQEDSPAGKAKLRKGDIIQKTETKGDSILRWKPISVDSLDSVDRAVSEALKNKNRLALIVKRGAYEGLMTFVELEE